MTYSASDTAPIPVHRDDLPVPAPADGTGGPDDGIAPPAMRWAGLRQQVASLPFVSRTPEEAAADLTAAAAAPGRTRGEHVHLANAYSVAVAANDPHLALAFHRDNGWLLPDGRPVGWVSSLRSDDPRLTQVRGPQLMLDVAALGCESGLRHYLLGGDPETLEQLRINLEDRCRGIAIVGVESPPFRPPTAEELVERDARIRRSGADVVWVGLGTPKQDVEAERLADSLPVVAVAVGAAFDYAAGRRRPAPHWISVIGFEWLWRLVAEPRRLWRRYLFGNARFVVEVLRDELRRRRTR